MATSNLNGIEAQLFRDLVEVNFQRVTRLRCAMSALWTTRGFVRKGTQTLKLVTGHVIRHCLKRARVERTRNAVTSVRTTIEERLKMHRSDRAVVLHSSLHSHQHRMATAMTIKNFFACQGHLHGSSGKHRQLANHDFVIERITLAAKTATIRSRNYTNVTRRQTENFRECTVHVVWRLSGTPERDLSV